jgi:hypothetical protein
MSKPYRPSNGSEGMVFMEQFCFKCGRDAKYQETQDGKYGCPILSSSLFANIDHPLYPCQYWIQDDDGNNPRCEMFAEDK